MAKPIRVCVVTWQLQPDSGWGRYSLGLVRGLREHGLDVYVLTERRAPVPSELAGTRVIPCLSTPLAALDRPLPFVWNLLQVFRHAPGTDLVHFFVEPYAMAASLAFPWPYLITVHGTYGVIPLRSNPVTRRLFGRSMRRAEAVICVSGFTRRRVAEAARIDNLAVINNGLELPRVGGGGSATDRSAVAGRPILLGVGALKPRKGYHVGIQALPRIRERYPDVHYYLVGDDQDRRYVSQLEQSVRELGLEHNVTITGRIDESRLDQLYRSCDVFLLPPVNSGVAFEGFGLTYLEANAYGKPVVGSDNCGAEDAISDGENGWLAPQSDPLAVADRVLRLLDDPAAAGAMGARGRQRALERDWSRVAGEYVDLYERALGR